VTASRPTRAIILAEIKSRLTEQYGVGVVASPSKTLGYELLRELSRGTNAFEGSTKGKRSIADRPPQVTSWSGAASLMSYASLSVFSSSGPSTTNWDAGHGFELVS
jgi:hypothetical protein